MNYLDRLIRLSAICAIAIAMPCQVFAATIEINPNDQGNYNSLGNHNPNVTTHPPTSPASTI